jgi:adenylate cyclase
VEENIALIVCHAASVVDAVQCGVEIQQVLRAKNALLPETRRMEFRIGINLGDVIEEGDTIYGDGVNIAARLEALAEPGGIAISESGFQQIENKLPLHYDYLGEHQVKNIARPIKVYRARIVPQGAPSQVIKEKKPKGIKLSRTVLAGIAIAVIIGAAVFYQFVFRLAAPRTNPASIVKTALRIPDKPSIAVLSFKNLSGSPDQEFLADGITESIIGSVSRASGLFVIASNSVFTYKGKPVKVQTISEELGVRNILEGTVQKAGDRLRVNVQLIDAATARHLWSEKYDREMKDVFSVQDDISKEILTALRVNLVEGEQERVFAQGTKNLEAYLKFLEAYNQFKNFTKQNMIRTRAICEEAVKLDPKYEAPYSLLGTTHLIDIWFNWGDSPQSSIEKAISPLQKGVALRPDSDFAYACLGHLFFYRDGTMKP